jgi:predicted amidohydrolase
MKIAVAQTKSIKGAVEKNIDYHEQFIKLAVANKVDLIVFPELSLTGYEPELAQELASHQDDKQFDTFQDISDKQNIIICVGMPTHNYNQTGILISLIIFQPREKRLTYSKQQLHSDEFPYFTQGDYQVILPVDNHKVAFGICYESLQPEHSENAHKAGADIYIASVAKSANGITKAFKHYPTIAEKLSIPVLMSNCLGFCHDFMSVGNSAVWNNKGLQLSKLSDTDEGIIVFDTITDKVSVLVYK